MSRIRYSVHEVGLGTRLRFYLAMVRCLWGAAIRWPLNPTGARVFWLLFLIGWRDRP